MPLCVNSSEPPGRHECQHGLLADARRTRSGPRGVLPGPSFVRRTLISSCGRRLLPLAALAGLAAAACSGNRVQLPVDPGIPLAGYSDIHRDLAAGCAGIRTLTTGISLSGRAGNERLRGTLAAGFRTPNDMLLELRAGPLRTAIFRLGANADGATLFLPRDRQVVRGRRGEDILAAVTGIDLSPADLFAILSGCVVPSPSPTGGRSHPGGWVSIDLGGAATLYAQRSGNRWRLRAARRGPWRIEYLEWPEASRFPRRIALTADEPVAVDLQATLTEPEANVDLDDDVFVVMVPSDAEVIALERLRQAGPLRSQ